MTPALLATLAALSLATVGAGPDGAGLPDGSTAAAAQPASAPGRAGADEVALGGWTAAIPLGVLGLFGVGWVGLRRKGQGGRLLELIETSSLGPKRSLILARVGDQTLLIGSSEAGITLLTAQPVSLEKLAEHRSGAESAPFAESSGWTRIFGRKPSPRPFQSYLDEPCEDGDLRQKLAAGLSETVR